MTWNTVKSSEDPHSVYCLLNSWKRKWGGGGAYQHLLGNAQSLFFFFLENTQDNRSCVCGGEQRARGTEVAGDFPLLNFFEP